MRLSQIPVGILFEGLEDLEEGSITGGDEWLQQGKEIRRQRHSFHKKYPEGSYTDALKKSHYTKPEIARDNTADSIRVLKKSNPKSYAILRKNVVSAKSGSPEERAASHKMVTRAVQRRTKVQPDLKFRQDRGNRQGKF